MKGDRKVTKEKEVVGGIEDKKDKEEKWVFLEWQAPTGLMGCLDIEDPVDQRAEMPHRQSWMKFRG